MFKLMIYGYIYIYCIYIAFNYMHLPGGTTGKPFPIMLVGKASGWVQRPARTFCCADASFTRQRDPVDAHQRSKKTKCQTAMLRC